MSSKIGVAVTGCDQNVLRTDLNAGLAFVSRCIHSWALILCDLRLHHKLHESGRRRPLQSRSSALKPRYDDSLNPVVLFILMHELSTTTFLINGNLYVSIPPSDPMLPTQERFIQAKLMASTEKVTGA